MLDWPELVVCDTGGVPAAPLGLLILEVKQMKAHEHIQVFLPVLHANELACLRADELQRPQLDTGCPTLPGSQWTLARRCPHKIHTTFLKREKTES